MNNSFDIYIKNIGNSYTIIITDDKGNIVIQDSCNDEEGLKEYLNNKIPQYDDYLRDTYFLNGILFFHEII